MADLNQQLQNLSTQMTTFNENQTKMLVSVNSIETKVNKLDADAEKQKTMLQEMQKENAELKRELENVKRMQQNKIQQERNNDILITGIPPVKNENLMDLFLGITKALNLNIPSIGVDCIFRSKKRDIIIVRLLRRLDKHDIVRSAKQKHLTEKDIGFESEANIYINESLSSYLAKIFFEARQIQKDFAIKFVWHKDGKIFLKKGENEEALQIGSLEEIHQLRGHLQAIHRKGDQGIPKGTSSEATTIESQNDNEQMDTATPTSPTPLSHPPRTEQVNAEVQRESSPANDDSFPPLSVDPKSAGRINSWAMTLYDN